MLDAALLVVALELMQLTGPDNQAIEVNPEQVVSVREPRVNEHFAPNVHCLLHTTDGKFIAVIQTCVQVDLIMHGTDSK